MIQQLTSGWTMDQIAAWRDDLVSSGKRRDYAKLAAAIRDAARQAGCSVKQYATDPHGNPLLFVRSPDFDPTKKTVLVTAGVHGYEPSGIYACVELLSTRFHPFLQEFNFHLFPCLCPWSFEYDHRWNADANDPNRMFFDQSGVPECLAFMNAIASEGVRFSGAVDLHETRDIDIELNDLRNRRFGLLSGQGPYDYDALPQGYYVIVSADEDQDASDRRLRYGRALIDAVGAASPIAPEPTILGGVQNLRGVAPMAMTPGTMRAFLEQNCDLVAVTEAYPDHPRMTTERCVTAQMLAVEGALRFMSSTL